MTSPFRLPFTAGFRVFLGFFQGFWITRGSWTSWFFRKKWEALDWVTGTAYSCRGGHILQHSFPVIIWSLHSVFGNEESQNWGGLTMETTIQFKTFLGMASNFYTLCANSTSSWPKPWLNMSMVGLWLWIRLAEKGLTCSNESSGCTHTRNPVRLRHLQSIWHQD